MWGRGVDVCFYFGVGVRVPTPLEIFSAKIAIFESFIDNSSLNDHTNFGGQYPHPQGAMSPLKLFVTFAHGDAYWYYGCLLYTSDAADE